MSMYRLHKTTETATMSPQPEKRQRLIYTSVATVASAKEPVASLEQSQKLLMSVVFAKCAFFPSSLTGNL